MKALTINLDEAVVQHVEESARREHKSVSEWVTARLTTEADQAAALAAMEAHALANGYPRTWLALFGSLADGNSFAPPPRGATRPVETLNGD